MRRTPTRRTTTVLTLTGAAALALLAGASPTMRCRCPDPRPGPSVVPSQNLADKSLYQRFATQQWEGLSCQLNSVSANVNYSTSSWGSPGARVNRSMSIGGILADFSGRRIFRVTAAPRLIELTDLEGNDLTMTSQVSVHPQPNNIQPFTAPNGSNIYQNFSVSLNSPSGGITGIGRVALEIDAQMAAGIERFDFKPELSEAEIQIAPNFMAKISRYNVTSNGAVYLTLDYRIPAGDGPKPAFHILELIDTNGDVMHTIKDSKEIVTPSATTGHVFIKGADLGSRELASIRLTALTDLITHTFTLEEHNLSLLGR